MDWEQVEGNGIMSGKEVRDPQPSTNDASISDDKAQSVSAPSNNAEVMSTQHDHHHLTKLLGERACPEDAFDRSCQSRESSMRNKFHDSKISSDEQVSDQVLRKARVSVRARSEAPMVYIPNSIHPSYFHLSKQIDEQCIREIDEPNGVCFR